jgi:hypothetical protein
MTKGLVTVVRNCTGDLIQRHLQQHLGLSADRRFEGQDRASYQKFSSLQIASHFWVARVFPETCLYSQNTCEGYAGCLVSLGSVAHFIWTDGD